MAVLDRQLQVCPWALVLGSRIDVLCNNEGGRESSVLSTQWRSSRREDRAGRQRTRKRYDYLIFFLSVPKEIYSVAPAGSCSEVYFKYDLFPISTYPTKINSNLSSRN